MTTEQEPWRRCTVQAKLNCGCCANIETLDCDLQAGHPGPHYEMLHMPYGLRYEVFWVADDERDPTQIPLEPCPATELDTGVDLGCVLDKGHLRPHEFNLSVRE